MAANSNQPADTLATERMMIEALMQEAGQILNKGSNASAASIMLLGIIARRLDRIEDVLRSDQPATIMSETDERAIAERMGDATKQP